MSTFPQRTDGTTSIDHILTQEANRIGEDILRHTSHVSPWIDLLPRGVFPSGMGFQLNSLVYDRVLPKTPDNTYDTVGTSWTNVGASALATTNNDIGTGIIEDSSPDRVGPNVAASLNRVDFTRLMRQYNLERAVTRSPEINVDDLRFAAHRDNQLSAIVALMAESHRWAWEERGRDEFMRIISRSNGGVAVEANTATAVPTNTTSISTYGYLDGAGAGTSNDPFTDAAQVGTVANISNKVMDMIYYRLVRAGAGMNSYGVEAGRPIFAAVMSSEASYLLKTETGFREDMRNDSGRVSELLAPLGVSNSFRGYYHIIDDLAPRFNQASAAEASDGDVTLEDDYIRVDPYTISSGRIIPNAAYESAQYEVILMPHPDVMEVLIPEPISGAAGITFDPVNYRGDFRWVNIPHEDRNPDGTVGHFRSVMSSASKPCKPEYGYAVIFDRTTGTLAA